MRNGLAMTVGDEGLEAQDREALLGEADVGAGHVDLHALVLSGLRVRAVGRQPLPLTANALLTHRPPSRRSWLELHCPYATCHSSRSRRPYSFDYSFDNERVVERVVERAN